jgi:iron complex transport system ATP-binding protein
MMRNDQDAKKFPGRTASDRGAQFENAVSERHSAASGSGGLSARTAAESSGAKPLEIDNLSFSYGGHNVLDGVTFSLNRGEFAAVMGPNGTGKSTLFRLILGLLTPQSGRISVSGHDIRSLSDAQRAENMAYIPQSVNPVFNYTVEEVVLMGLTGQLGTFARPKDVHRCAVRDVLKSLGMEKLIHRGFGRISGGERQLVLLARALVQKAGILIMDEPTANLDYGNQHRVLQKAWSLTEDGYTVLMSTHSPEQAFLYADRAIVLCGGHVIADGAPRSVLTENMLEKIYGIPVLLADQETEGGDVKICLPKQLPGRRR